MNFSLQYLALVVASAFAVSPVLGYVQERQLDSVFSSATAGAGTVVGGVTSAAGSVGSDITSFAGSIGTVVESAGGSAFTVVSQAGGSAITLAGSAGGVVETFAGSVYTVATNAAASVTNTGGGYPRYSTPSIGMPFVAALCAILAGIMVGVANVV